MDIVSSPFPSSSPAPVSEYGLNFVPDINIDFSSVVDDISQAFSDSLQNFLPYLSDSLSVLIDTYAINEVTSINSYVLNYLSGIVLGLPSEYYYLIVPGTDSYSATLYYSKDFIYSSGFVSSSDSYSVYIYRSYYNSQYHYNIVRNSGVSFSINLNDYLTLYTNSVVGYPSFTENRYDIISSHFFSILVPVILFLQFITYFKYIRRK